VKKSISLSNLRAKVETKQFLSSSINKPKRDDFYGFGSFDKLKKEMSIPFEQIESNYLNDSSNTISNSIAGFAPNVPAYLNGEPECMYNFEFTETANYHELNFYISLPWDVKSGEIREQGKELAEYLRKNTSPKDKFKISFFGFFENLKELDTRLSHKITEIDLEIIVCDYDDYMTNDILNLICTSAMFRFYMLNSLSYFQGIKKHNTNGNPIPFNDAISKRKELKLMDFMNIETELNKIEL
jgi:hypothetical protein